MTETERFIAKAAERAAPVFQAEGWKWSSDPHDAKTMFVPSASEIALAWSRLLDGFGNDEDEEYRPLSRMSGRLMVIRVEDGIKLALDMGHIERTWSDPEGPDV